MKRRLLYFTFAFLFLMSVVPFSAFVPEALAEENVVCVGGVVMKKGDYLPVGATETQESMPDEGYAFYNGSELILNDYSYTGDGFYCEEKYDKYGKCTVEELLRKLQTMSKTQISQELGCSRMTLYRVIKNIEVRKPSKDTSIWHYTS